MMPRVDSEKLIRYLRTEGAAEDYVDERVDGSGFPLYLDSMGSMSALAEAEAAARFEAVERFIFPEGSPQ